MAPKKDKKDDLKDTIFENKVRTLLIICCTCLIVFAIITALFPDNHNSTIQTNNTTSTNSQNTTHIDLPIFQSTSTLTFNNMNNDIQNNIYNSI